ncbi:hypothetical protein V1499_07720 [Neobacillus sp. SCS-31]|uniref:hypothetical protein n=1 Tax=Neobacillus oceani TaxID=3115292 RepID=UPI003906BBD5
MPPAFFKLVGKFSLEIFLQAMKKEKGETVWRVVSFSSCHFTAFFGSVETVYQGANLHRTGKHLACAMKN